MASNLLTPFVKEALVKDIRNELHTPFKDGAGKWYKGNTPEQVRDGLTKVTRNWQISPDTNFDVSLTKLGFIIMFGKDSNDRPCRFVTEAR